MKCYPDCPVETKSECPRCSFSEVMRAYGQLVATEALNVIEPGNFPAIRENLEAEMEVFIKHFHLGVVAGVVEATGITPEDNVDVLDTIYNGRNQSDD